MTVIKMFNSVETSCESQFRFIAFFLLKVIKRLSNIYETYFINIYTVMF